MLLCKIRSQQAVIVGIVANAKMVLEQQSDVLGKHATGDLSQEKGLMRALRGQLRRDRENESKEIVQRLLLCLESGEPQHFSELAAMQLDRMDFRIPGIPFLKPNRETEQRIARRLGLMSYAAIEQRREKHLKKFLDVRERLLEERNLKEVNSTTQSSRTTQIPSKERMAIVRNLLRNARENELRIYASLLADGNFARLAELEKIKNANNTLSGILRSKKLMKEENKD
ncbi:hypothetical protein RB195_019942 [Necator americanus]|uniref:RPEL repeat protein n=1 Tax=Necator americanus TaxID=51031 RepID=A0ABR1CIN7_NECAM